MKQKEWNRKLQEAMNEAGATPKFDASGVFGPRTEMDSERYDIAVTAKLKVTTPTTPIDTRDFFGAIWVGVDLDLLGRKETDKELERRYETEWEKVGLPYDDLIGRAHAWCILRMIKAYRQVKIDVKGLTAAAKSLSKWGKKCPFWFGAGLDIEHKGGGRHAAIFLYWINEAKKIAATLDGNRNNEFNVFATDLSGKGDHLVEGPRWPNGWPDGSSPAMAEVLAAYPMLKVGGAGSSTT